MSGAQDRTFSASIAEQADAMAAGAFGLADAVAVRNLFREFIGGALERSGDAALGSATWEGVQEADLAAGKALVVVLAGDDPEWPPVRGWTKAEKGGFPALVRKALAGEADADLLARSPAEAVATYALSRAYEIIAGLPESTEDAAREAVNAAAEDCMRLVIGAPNDAAFEGGAAAE